jgi:hypothetical protein
VDLSFVADFNKLGKCQDVTGADMETESAGKRTRRGTSGTVTPGVSDPPLPDADQGDRLQSWKQIAAFLGHDERTVMRWERSGMPVHRIPGTKRSRVYASRVELTEWLAERREDSPAQITTPAKSASLNLHTIGGSVIAVLAVAVIVFVLARSLHAGLPVKATFIGDALMAQAADGKTLWTYEFHRSLDPMVLAQARETGNGAKYRTSWARTADLSGDGDRQVIAIVPYALGPNERDRAEFEIDCFSSRGKLLWTYAPHEAFQFGTHDVHGPWHVLDLIVSRLGSKKSIYVAFSHHLWGNSFVAELDPTTGRGKVRYVNTGDTYALAEVKTSRATYLIAAGFNNEHDGGSAALIDERRPFSASPQTDGTRHKCTSCPEGSPDYYFVFPRSEGNRILKDYMNAIETIEVVGSEIEFSKFESKGPYMDAIYLVGLEPSIHPISLRYGSTYELQHRELERSHELRHTLEQCPERVHPSPVRMWTPSGGWTELSFGPSRFDQ